jgi:type IV secretory pathway VirB2 component (pilin)
MKRVLGLLPLLFPLLVAPAQAAAGGSSLPFNEPITTVVENLTGPTASSIIIIVFFAGLLTLALGRDQGWLKVLGGAIVIGALMAKSASLPGVLGLSAATSKPVFPLAGLLLAAGLFLIATVPFVLLREPRSPQTTARA